MPTTLRSDMKIYDPRMQIGYRERIAQVIEVFNGASGGSIRLATQTKPGDFDYKAFFKRASGIVSRRDLTSTSAATAIKIDQGEQVGVKVNRKVGPLDVARGALIKAGIDPNDDAAAVAFGEFVAEAALEDRVNTSIAAMAAALGNQSSVKLDISGGSGGAELVTTNALNSVLAKRGDRAPDVIAWVMHSKAYFNLVDNQITAGVTGIASVVANGGMPATLNRPVLITDSTELIVAGTPDKYITLGLTADAVTVTDTEEEYMVPDVVTGGEQIIHRLQGEYAYNLDLMGFAWDVANGGSNPTNATLKTGSNWDPYVASYKNYGGVYLLSQ